MGPSGHKVYRGVAGDKEAPNGKAGQHAGFISSRHHPSGGNANARVLSVPILYRTLLKDPAMEKAPP
jgi:hypothetical protein